MHPSGAGGGAGGCDGGGGLGGGGLGAGVAGGGGVEGDGVTGGGGGLGLATAEQSQSFAYRPVLSGMCSNRGELPQYRKSLQSPALEVCPATPKCKNALQSGLLPQSASHSPGVCTPVCNAVNVP